MYIFNIKKRIQYLGFNDTWFSIIGILVISNVANYLFNNPFERPSLDLVLIGWFASLIHTICHWYFLSFCVIGLRKKYPSFKDDFKRISLLVLIIITITPVIDFICGNLIAKGLTLLGYTSTFISLLKTLVAIIIMIIMIMAIYEAIYYNIRLKKSIREEEQLKQVMIQAQLDTLRNQAQPHFLFNSLNTLRAIIDEDEKEDAKDFVDKLSDVYRFILESGNANLTSLQKELKFVKSYVHIQLERFGENLKIHWDIPEEKLLLQIVPMSLQLLIENAIKHNVVSRAKPLHISVKAIDNQLIVQNKIQAKSTKVPSTKIGLKNIEKRYALISDQSIAIKNNGQDFIVSIPLLKTIK